MVSYLNSLFLVLFPYNLSIYLKFKSARIGKSTEIDKWLLGIRAVVTAYAYRVSFWDDKNVLECFPDAAVVTNPPANAGDTGSSPRPGRSHMLRSN